MPVWIIRPAFFYVEYLSMDETLDSLPFGDLRLAQSKNGYRFSLDPILLARFIKLKRWQRVVDLGTGSGILPLVLARISRAGELIGIELQAAMAERACRNVELNNLQDRIQICHGDIRQIEEMFNAGTADLVVSNPPFRGVGSGRIAPDDERAIARHELAGGLDDFVAAARWLLRYGGEFNVIYLAERLPELIVCIKKFGLEPKRVRLVYPRSGDSAKMVMVEAKKGGKPGVEMCPPLTIYRDCGASREYTEDILRMYEM
jgi:tRNA1(Val) A37 N6-methylase TrmN6